MTDNNIVYQVDTFTDQLFKGNAAGVMLVDHTVDEAWMQAMAAEMNLSETAYITPHGATYDIRYFTPTVEVPLCGHATLASAYLLFSLGVKGAHEEIVFHAKGGELRVTKEGDWISMNFPTYPLTPIAIPEGFKEAVGFQPIETYASSYGWVIGVASTEEEISQALPDAQLLKEKGLGHLMITAASKKVDYVVRCFAPDAGIYEDPVTGSAQCALVPLWHAKTGKHTFDAVQVSKRSGELKLHLIGDRVQIKGKCRTVFKAVLER